MDKEELEPAFPRSYTTVGHNGMTLRDWFAGQAMAGLCVGHRFEADSLAKLSYERADAMLAERAK